MKDKALYAGVLAALPPLMLAAAGWLEAQSQKNAKLDLADNYGAYIEDRLRRDAALERALMNCMALIPAPPGADEGAALGAVVPLEPPPVDELNLDDVAEEFGYEQRMAPE